MHHVHAVVIRATGYIGEHRPSPILIVCWLAQLERILLRPCIGHQDNLCPLQREDPWYFWECIVETRGDAYPASFCPEYRETASETIERIFHRGHVRLPVLSDI